MAITAIKGFNDILPDESGRWIHIEQAARRVFELNGFSQIRVPIMEKTELFSRSIGDATDIVEKEMYTFIDKGENNITLRQALLPGTDVSLRTAAEGALPPVSPDWGRGDRYK